MQQGVRMSAADDDCVCVGGDSHPSCFRLVARDDLMIAASKSAAGQQRRCQHWPCWNVLLVILRARRDVLCKQASRGCMPFDGRQTHVIVP